MTRCAYLRAKVDQECWMLVVSASRPLFRVPGHVRCRELRKRRIKMLLKKEQEDSKNVVSISQEYTYNMIKWRQNTYHRTDSSRGTRVDGRRGHRIESVMSQSKVIRGVLCRG